MKTIETERIILRKLNHNDKKDVLELLSDPIVNEFLPMFPLKNTQEAIDYIDAHQEQYHFAIELKETNKVIGYINVSSKDSHELGYALSKGYWNKGITSEACKALIPVLKKDGLPFITATHDINNPNSGKVMEKNGMTYHYSYDECVQPKNQNVTFKMYQLNFDPKSDVYKGFGEQTMKDIAVSEMIQMQKDLYEANKNNWPEPKPENAKLSFLWMIEEIGECISIIKKKGDDLIMNDPKVRDHFTEEMVDVFLYASQILMKYEITPEEFSKMFEMKHNKNMKRDFVKEYENK